MQFGLNSSEINNNIESAKENPFDPIRDNPPGFFDGSGEATLSGLAQGTGQMLLLQQDIKQSLGFEQEDEDKAWREDLVTSLKDRTPSPDTTGWLGRVLYGLTSVGIQAGTSALTGPLGMAATVAGSQGNTKTATLQQEGVDPSTARKVGAVEGITQGLGVIMPASVPGTLGIRVASGATINISMGAAERGAAGSILAANGYKDMAEQYKVMDGAEIFTDAILGGAFGALPHGQNNPLPSETDAALAANNLHHLEIESAPGLPTDPQSRDAHIEAVNQATAQLIGGQSVDVGDITGNMSLVARQIGILDDAQVESFMRAEGYADALDTSLPAGNDTPSGNSPGGAVSSSPNATSGAGSQALPFNRTVRSDPSGIFSTATTDPATLKGPLSKLGIKVSPTGDKSIIYQANSDVNTLHQTAKQTVKPLKEFLSAHAEEVPGAKLVGVRAKELDTVKTKLDAGRDPARVSDYLGGRLVADTNEGLRTLAQNLSRDAHVIEVDDFLDSPGGKRGSGYRAIHMQLATKDGFSYEVQLHPREIAEVYDSTREAYAKWKDYRGNIPADKVAEFEADTAAAKKTFDDAYAKYQKREAGIVKKQQDEAAARAQLDPMEAAARDAVEANPELQIMDEDGNVVSAKEALEAADATIAQAEKDSGVFSAAVNCFMKFGDA